MKPVNQTIVSKKDGDCTRACLATILELEIDAVPNFMRFKGLWFRVMWAFLKALGYDYFGTGWPISNDRPKGHILHQSPNIHGLVMATVPSRTFKDIGHSVVINLKGMVVHDPNPNKLWQGVNVLKSKDLQHWMMIGEKEKK
jgi:hypothetical protein